MTVALSEPVSPSLPDSKAKGEIFLCMWMGSLCPLAVKMACRMQQGREIDPNLPPKEELWHSETNSPAMSLQESNVWEGMS